MNNNFYHVEKNECFSQSSEDNDIINEDNDIINEDNDIINEDNVDDGSVTQINYQDKTSYKRLRSLTPPRKYRANTSSYKCYTSFNILFLFTVSLIVFMFPNFSFSLCVTLSLNVIYKQIMYELHIENVILQTIGVIIPFFILNNFTGIIIANLILHHKDILGF